MAFLIVESANTHNLKLIAKIAKQLNCKVQSIPDKDLMDFESNTKDELLEFVFKGIERGLADVKAGRIKSFDEIKKMNF